MHGSVGASCAVADVKGEVRRLVADAGRVSAARQLRDGARPRPEKVKVIFSRGSGCYGINGADTVSYDAALLSQAFGRPVRVQLSRHDEMAHENYGLAFVVDQRVGLDREGNIVAWDYEAWSPARGGRPGYNARATRSRGTSSVSTRCVCSPITGARAGCASRQRSNIVPSYVSGTVNGVSGGTGTVKASACSRVSSSRRSGPDLFAPRIGCRTPSRTNA